VDRIGGARLAQRAARVAVIETECGEALDPAPAHDTPADIGAPRKQTLSLTGATSPTVAVRGLARTNDQTTVDVPGESAGTGVATVSDMHAPRRRRLISAVSVASLIGAVGVLGLALAVSAGTRSRDHSASGESRTPPLAAPTLPAVPAPPTDSAAPGEASEGHPAPVEASGKKTVAPHLRQRPGCVPPYTIDPRGLHHYKPECI
jgi:hypothetical protein